MSTPDDLKRAKIAFVSNNKGDSLFRINVICVTALTTYGLWTAIQAGYRLKGPQLLLADFLILCLPLLLVLTVLADHALLFNALITGVVMLLYNNNAQSKPVTSKSQAVETKATHRRVVSEVSQLQSPAGNKKPFYQPFVTVYRAHMMLMTVICILAVDFPAFPRSFGKCETWGTSIMDLGVGSFVFTLGLVQALPILRSEWQPPLRFRLVKALRSCLGILALGVGRVIMVKGVDYPEHITEYGVHWNFFFTLAVLPLFGTILQDMKKYITFTSMALIISAVHQICLSNFLEEWVLDAPRINLISANKEGIASLLGYLAIYLVGTDTGLVVLPPDPYYAYRSAEKRRKVENGPPKTGKMVTLLMSMTCAWWIGYAASTNKYILDLKVSRQMANLPYMLWVAGFNTSFLLGYNLVQQLFANHSLTINVPQTFEAINRHSLAVFLIANLMTGLVNMTFTTITASNTTAMVILTAYLAALCALTNMLPKRPMKL